MSKLKIGDRVISVVNTPEQQEGFIGTVISFEEGFEYPILVSKDNEKGEEVITICKFRENELALLKDKIENPTSALDKQVSGDHYKSCGIQPIEYIHANGLSYLEGNVIKYTTRHSKKNGRQDIEKAIHYLELILEMEYKDESK